MSDIGLQPASMLTGSVLQISSAASLRMQSSGNSTCSSLVGDTFEEQIVSPNTLRAIKAIDDDEKKQKVIEMSILMAGEDFAMSGELKKAVLCFQKACQHFPHSMAAMDKLAVTLTAQGRFTDALNLLNEALAFHDPDPTLLLHRADAHEKMEHYDAALEDLNAVIHGTEPSVHGPHRAARGRILFRAGCYHKATADLTAAMTADPYLFTAYYYRGLTFGRLSHYAESVRDLTRALEIKPNDSKAMLSRAVLWSLGGRHQLALEDCNKALVHWPKSANPLMARAAVFCIAGKYTDAEADYTRILIQDLTHTGALAGRAFSRYHLGRLKQGLADITKAIKTNPGDATLYLCRGLINSKMKGRERKSQADFDTAVEIKGRLGDIVADLRLVTQFLNTRNSFT
ncbi:TPR repeat [Carpediemonas membranifera]|uniref:TPR repeat n=1 Tax=Carpediemonas membranifera TaxID=201153 RepID=A0A8J6ATK5_9EUKA|nr:TPR repeat [Carpediemonas membranifera]|eukprot:KAG9393763.1 TPR repeat [Carpediemonas membranifera]